MDAETYETSIQILMCALGHDRTNREVQHTLAERHLAHAIAMDRLNNHEKALEAVGEALRFNPRLSGANELYERLLSPQ